MIEDEGPGFNLRRMRCIGPLLVQATPLGKRLRAIDIYCATLRAVSYNPGRDELLTVHIEALHVVVCGQGAQPGTHVIASSVVVYVLATLAEEGLHRHQRLDVRACLELT